MFKSEIVLIALIMDLFKPQNNTINQLPYDGEVVYYPAVFTREESYTLFHQLQQEILWKPDRYILFGKEGETARKVAWYGDYPYSYRYSQITKTALPWTQTLSKMKKRVEDSTNETYNSCLLNLYHSGEEGMGWHSDGEKMLKKNGAIASISLGAERKFSFKHKVSNKSISLLLEQGSLLIMKGETQKHWLHRLPPTKRIKTPRINLTFRTIEPRSV